MNEDRIIFTGGSGLLGGEIKKLLPKAWYPSSRDFDVTNYELMADQVKGRGLELLIHAAAFTSPPRADKEPLLALETNIVGTANVVKLCITHGMKLVYISTDYVFSGNEGMYREDDPVNPVNKYAWSKLGGECAVRLHENSLIIRTSFGPNVFPYEAAFVDQWTSRVSVSEVARKIAGLVTQQVTGVIHVGGNRKTVHEYAKTLDKHREIKTISTADVAFTVPRDTSLDCTRYDELMGTTE